MSNVKTCFRLKSHYHTSELQELLLRVGGNPFSFVMLYLCFVQAIIITNFKQIHT